MRFKYFVLFILFAVTGLLINGFTMNFTVPSASITVRAAGGAISTGTEVASGASRDGLMTEVLAAGFDGTYLNDSSGRGMTFALVNAPVAKLPGGPFDDGDASHTLYLSMNGSTRMVCASSSWASAGQDLWCVFVVNATSTVNQNLFMAGLSPNQWTTQWTPITMNYTYRGNPATDIQDWTLSPSPLNGKHTYIIVSQSDGNAKLYLDGVEQAGAGALSTAAVMGTMCIGAADGSRGWSGKFYTFRAYSGRLPTAAEITATYWDH